MIHNAKQYNERGSEVFEDAEKVRKTFFNFMKQHNPAYNDRSYVATPTPIPGEDNSPAAPTVSTPTVAGNSRRQSESKLRHSESVAPDADEMEVDEEADEEGAGRFRGLTLMQAQEQIMEELIDYAE
jgi:hypothetical protein